MKPEAYIDTNTAELREWLRSVGIGPVEYPEETRPGLTAPYPDCMGEPKMYRSGLRYTSDSDYSDFEIYTDPEDFKKHVLDILGKCEVEIEYTTSWMYVDDSLPDNLMIYIKDQEIADRIIKVLEKTRSEITIPSEKLGIMPIGPEPETGKNMIIVLRSKGVNCLKSIITKHLGPEYIIKWTKRE